MAVPSHIQYSFNAGEWAPALNSRVDLAKYKSGAALLQNYFVDYRGGASSRAGTKYILQALKSSSAVRLIPFQASVSVGYILEFGDLYIRFYNNGAPVLETAFNVTGVTLTNPCVVAINGNDFQPNDVIFIDDIVGTTQLNNKYFTVTSVAGNDVTIADLNGVPIDATAYTAWASAGTGARVYTLASPYLATDLALVKFAQNVDKLILCHPSYVPYVLTIISADDWTLVPITFGTSVATPTNVLVATTLAVGTVNYAYVITAVDINGQESGVSTAGTLANKTDLRTVAGTNRITWDAISGADSYNVYKAELSYTNVVAAGAQFGFIGNCSSTTFDDSNIAPDFSQTPPVAQNPFSGARVESATVTAPGVYTTVPSVTIAAPSTGATATASAVLQVQSTVGIGAGSTGGWSPGDLAFFSNGVVLVVATTLAGNILTYEPLTAPGSNRGSITSGAVPAGTQTGSGPNGGAGSSQTDFVWGVGIVNIVNHGSGYTTAPAITFSAGLAAATAVLGETSAGNPSVVGFFQQRMVLAAQTNAPQNFFMSQPGSYYNFDTTDPAQANDGIYGTLVSGQLNTIRSMISQPSGLILLSDKASWLVNGGSAGSAVDAVGGTIANAQSFSGASDVPPIVSNYDILFVQAKNSIVRDNSFNFYANVFTGTDISVISSHLFYGYQVLEWAWAEEPFKLVWAIRDDGTLLSLTFLKEQEFIGWAHSTTQGTFKSVATITEETTDAGIIDAIYLVVERTINGNVVKYIERMAERIFPNGASSAWCVDAGLQYSGSPATSFSGGEHLAGATIVGLADGVVITPFVMPTDGNFTLPSAASVVTVGLAFTPALQTLALDLGEPTVQGKPKKIVGVTVRVEDTLGLTIGSDSSHQVAMKDLVVGNVSTTLTGQSVQTISGLVTGDAYTRLDPTWTIPGQYYINQPNPLPSTILGVIPQITVGDTK